MSSASCGPDPGQHEHRSLMRVRARGRLGRENDLLFSKALPEKKAKENVIYFPGDVQDYASRMEQHAANPEWKKYSLEWTTERLQKRFPDANVVVVKPSRFEEDCYSCYDNFLVCETYGSPVHGEKSWARGYEHLLALLKDLSSQVEEDFSNDLTRLPLAIVGFSKGCVVLNQLVYEMHRDLEASPLDESAVCSWSRLSSMYWLDGGHSGSEGAWVTDEPHIKALSRAVRHIEVHTTSYQVNDPVRPWKGYEKTAFVQGLKRVGHDDLVDKFHYPDAVRSLHNHFRLLEDF